MRVIYEPRGRAKEYAPLATTPYTGCVHACEYCFSPDASRKTKEKFHTYVQPRKNYLRQLERDCQEMQGDPRQDNTGI